MKNTNGCFVATVTFYDICIIIIRQLLHFLIYNKAIELFLFTVWSCDLLDAYRNAVDDCMLNWQKMNLKFFSYAYLKLSFYKVCIYMQNS